MNTPITVIVALIATIFGVGSSKALAVKNNPLSEQTIAGRLANVREHLRIREQQATSNSNYITSLHSINDNKDESSLQASWNNNPWCNTDTCPSPPKTPEPPNPSPPKTPEPPKKNYCSNS